MEWTSSKLNDIVGDCIGYMLYNLSDYENVDIFSEGNKKKEIDKVRLKDHN